MNHLHIWCNLNKGRSERDFGENVQAFLSYLHEREYIEGYFLTRRKFLVMPSDLGEYLIIVQFKSLVQMNRAFEFVAAGADETKAFHDPIICSVKDMGTALYRDFPEPKKRRIKEEG
jgi:hypothetical protein